MLKRLPQLLAPAIILVALGKAFLIDCPNLIGQTQFFSATASNRFLGCVPISTYVSSQTYDLTESTLAPVNTDPPLEQRLRQILADQASFFKSPNKWQTPLFFEILNDPLNAYSDHFRTASLPRAGMISIGMPFAKVVYNHGLGFATAPSKSFGLAMFALQTVVAHEFAHQIQFFELDGYYKHYASNPKRIVDVELEADAIATAWLTLEWSCNDLEQQTMLSTFTELGNYAWTDPNFHGFPSDRRRAARVGQDLANHFNLANHFSDPRKARMDLFIRIHTEIYDKGVPRWDWPKFSREKVKKALSDNYEKLLENAKGDALLSYSRDTDSAFHLILNSADPTMPDSPVLADILEGPEGRNALPVARVIHLNAKARTDWRYVAIQQPENRSSLKESILGSLASALNTVRSIE